MTYRERLKICDSCEEGYDRPLGKGKIRMCRICGCPACGRALMGLCPAPEKRF